MKEYGYFDAVLPLMSMSHAVDFPKFQETYLDDILKNPQGRLVAVHHHHRGPGLDGFDATFEQMQETLEASGCSLIRITFLREPVAREISALYFNMGTEERFPEVLTNVTKAEFRNGEIRYILNNKMNEYGMEHFHFGNSVKKKTWRAALRKAERILSKFSFVGTMEQFDQGIAKICELIGEPHAKDIVRLRPVNVNSHYDLSNSHVIHLVKRAVKVDQKLYARFA